MRGEHAGWPAGLRNCVGTLTFLPAPSDDGEKEGSLEAYCLKCRERREMKDAKAITMKNGKPATEGTCPVCGTKMFKIGKA